LNCRNEVSARMCQQHGCCNTDEQGAMHHAILHPRRGDGST
jgi:hypothetical protein